MSAKGWIIALGMMIPSGLTAGLASDTSPWAGHERAPARLIAGPAIQKSDARLLRAGVELKISPGWKMYWRSPGGAGVGLRLDFTGSKNVRNIEVRWPAPERFTDGGTNLIVYQGQVLMPLHVTPDKEGEPVTIHLKLDYGICDKICILSEASMQLALSPQTTAYEEMFAAAEARVPRRTKLGEDGPLSIRSVRREAGTTLPRLTVDLTAPVAVSVDLFVEGPTCDWALPLPKAVSRDGGRHRFFFDLDGVPSGVSLVGSILRYTAVTSGGHSIEVSVPVD